MKFTFTVQNKDTGASEKFVTESGSSEVDWHIALKLIGYMLFFDRRPQIEQDVGWHYRPDLFAKNEEGKLDLWIDCGNIAVKKIDRVAKHMSTDGEFYILRRTVSDAKRLHDSFGSKVTHPERVRIIAFEDGFVDSIAETLKGTNKLSFSIQSGCITVYSDDIGSRISHIEQVTKCEF